MRYTLPDKKNLHWKGSALQFLWHFSSITARVIALSLFASLYPLWIGPACVAHWLIMSTWVVLQKTTACSTKCEELLFCLVLGAIYIFSFFNAKEERTRYKYLIYYTFCFVENSSLMVLWILNAKTILPDNQWYFYPAIIGHYAAFFCGLAFMIIYYVYFHPSGIELPFISKKQPENANGDATEMRPMSSLSVSTPALDEADNSKKFVRRTNSEPPCQTEVVNPRSWKLMTRDRMNSGEQ